MSPVIILFFIIIISLVSHASAAPTHLYTYCPNNIFFPFTNSALRSNLDTLLSDLSAAANSSSTPGFHNSAVGSPAVYGLYLCRGDDDAATCRDCVAAASAELSQNCSLGKQAVAWYDECMIRYSNASFFGQMDDNFNLLMWNTQNITGNVTHFDEVLSAALQKVATEAASGGAALKFKTEHEKFDEFRTVYALGQCTPDLSGADCYQCLLQSINSLPSGHRPGARVFFFSCNLRYEIYQFYQAVVQFSPIYLYCPPSTFFSATETVGYPKNIEALLTNLSSNANTSSAPGFYNSTIATNSSTVYGLYLCRGDVVSATCRECVAAASAYLPQNCPRGKQAAVFYDVCMIRYSNQYFFGQLDANPHPQYIYNTTNLTADVGPDFYNPEFGVAVSNASDSVIKKVAAKNKTYPSMIATDQENIVSSTRTIYMLAQCTPDLSTDDCNDCLNNCKNTLESCCVHQQGAGVYYFTCNLRFELNQFYLDLGNSSDTTSSTGASPATPGPITPTSTSKPKRHNTLIITGSVLAAIVLLFLGLALLFASFQRRKLKTASTDDLSDIETAESLQMDFNTIRAATQNFAIDKKLGEGGFGPVYKGTLDNGQEIAVKRLSENSGQGIVEFKTEVILVAKLQHRNLVKLLGFCVSGKEKILVYEFLPNSSLDKILFDPAKRMSLNWETRFKIICGIAKGLLYLHEDSRLRVVHRDLKSSNILLDEAMHPKIADFGLAKLFGVDQTQAVTDSISGTYGYMAPEYILMGHYSIKSDVYSFGIIVLEVVSGQRNKYKNRPLLEEALLYRAWKLWNEDEALKFVDGTLGENYAKEDVIKCIHIGLLCIQESVAKRPNMTSIVAALGGQSITLPLPSPPNFFNESSKSSTINSDISGVSSGQGVNTGQTSEITELYGR